MAELDLSAWTDADLHRYHSTTLRDARIATLACRHYEREVKRLNTREIMIRAEFDRRHEAECPEDATGKNHPHDVRAT